MIKDKINNIDNVVSSIKPIKLLSAMSAMSDTNYHRPKITLQDKLTYDEIKEKLKNYEKVENIVDLPLYTHLRYIEVKEVNGKKEYKFRLGGYLINKKFPDKYLVLSNGRLKWSVQVANTVFYKSLAKNEDADDPIILKQEIAKLKDLLVEKELEIKKLKNKNKELKELTKTRKSSKKK
jgi:hypothetical protein